MNEVINLEYLSSCSKCVAGCECARTNFLESDFVHYSLKCLYKSLYSHTILAVNDMKFVAIRILDAQDFYR